MCGRGQLSSSHDMGEGWQILLYTSVLGIQDLALFSVHMVHGTGSTLMISATLAPKARMKAFFDSAEAATLAQTVTRGITRSEEECSQSAANMSSN